MSRAAADALAGWAIALDPTEEDRALADRALIDTIAVAYAARRQPLREALGPLTEAGRWTALAHVLDFDDLHLPSTTHISAICVPAALSTGGGLRAYLAGAGVMARIGRALGWGHYDAGWHATCTAGAPAAAAAAAVARGLDAQQTANAIALAVPGAGGVQRAFGTDAKSLQVAFALEAGLRAAALAAAGAGADPRALDEWMGLMGGEPATLAYDGPAIPGGLAIKLYPCCYALQRPIAAVASLGSVDARRVRRVRVLAPRAALAPLIHDQPRTGMQGKFSLRYGVAAAVLDGHPGFASFSDPAVQRAAARRLMDRVEVEATEGGDHLLEGTVAIEITLDEGSKLTAELDRPPTAAQLGDKLAICGVPDLSVAWDEAAGFLRDAL
jgi:2-methylcitrate dehydratase PrpD